MLAEHAAAVDALLTRLRSPQLRRKGGIDFLREAQLGHSSGGFGIAFTVDSQHSHRHGVKDAQRRRMAWMKQQEVMMGAGGGPVQQLQISSTNSGTNAVGSLGTTFRPTVATSTLVMCIATVGGAGAATITMPAGWVQGPHLHVADANNTGAEIWYYPNNPGGISSSTVTLGSHNQVAAITFSEWLGLNANAPLDTSGTGSGNGTAASAQTAGNVGLPSDIVFGMAVAMVGAGTQTFTQTGGPTTPGFLKQGQEINAANMADNTVQLNFLPAAGAKMTFPTTLGISGPWVAAVAAFTQ